VTFYPYLKRIAWLAIVVLAAIGAVLLFHANIGRVVTVLHPNEQHQLGYADFLVVTLTALCAILAALAILVALLAIWGYSGIREETTKAVYKQAEKAIKSKMSEYPDAKQMFEILENLKEIGDRQLVGNQLAPSSAAKNVAQASKPGEDKPKRGKPLARDYPRKGNE
jgi:hypothetical protein